MHLHIFALLIPTADGQEASNYMCRTKTATAVLPAKSIERGVQGYEKVFSFIIYVCSIGNRTAHDCGSEINGYYHFGGTADQGPDRAGPARQVE